MREVFVAGAAMTRFGKFPDRTIRSLTEEAVGGALSDAGAGAAEVETAFFGNAVAGLLTGQEMVKGQVALRHTGVMGIPIVNVENACASSSSAFHLAHLAVASGSVDIALAVGAEKLTHPDKALAFGAIGTAVDLDEARERIRAAAADASPEATGGKRSPFMDVYAAYARAYMERSGATAADFAQVAVKSHHHGSLNPHAQYRDEVSADEVLASRMIAPPLTLLMCSPMGDGAAALVLCSADALARLGGPSTSAKVRVAATVMKTANDRRADEPGVVERASQRAYELAGVGPDDLDVVELHDAAAPAELILYEELGMCEPGEGPKLL
ncbi:MAG: thiolase family protein, partial [Acidimicrobiia bacterium]